MTNSQKVWIVLGLALLALNIIVAFLELLNRDYLTAAFNILVAAIVVGALGSALSRIEKQ
jgi:uncharacterized membrane protein YjjB (DUF3815 family)